MSLRLESWNETSLARLGALAADASLQPEYESLLGEGLARMMGDPFNREDCRRLAVRDGEDVGFGYALVVPTAEGRFAAFRIGVPERHRRSGIGTALLAEMRRQVAEVAADVGEIEIGAVLPNPAAEGFAVRHGFRPSRTYWLMERPAAALEAPEWPAGVTLRAFDGSDRDQQWWVDVVNRSWREHHHPIHATLDEMRRYLAGGFFDPAAMYFAERAGEPVGFVRGARHATRGEVAVLGVVPEERGRGIGRALLRFGSQWLLDHGAARITLYVDGENERALTLYRGERFEVIRTRQLWSRQP